jgi:hypothetical protein
VVTEAPLEKTEHGAFPAGEGWFVVNAREARWFESDGLGFYVSFEGENARFTELGINVGIVRPGEPGCMYHREEAQEDFLVLSGECLLIVEGRSGFFEPGTSCTVRRGQSMCSSASETTPASFSGWAHGGRDAGSSTP